MGSERNVVLLVILGILFYFSIFGVIFGKFIDLLGDYMGERVIWLLFFFLFKG